MTNYWGSFQGAAAGVYHLEADGTDSGGGGNNMTASAGTVTYTTIGKFGYCGYFGGAAALGASYSAAWSPTAFTAGVWVYSTDNAQAGHVFGNFGYNGGSYYGWTLRWDASGQPRVYIAKGDSGAGTEIANLTYSANAWHYVIITYNGTNTCYIYVDDAVAASSTGVATIANNSSACSPRIGCRVIYSGNERFFKGYIDEAWVLNGTALTASQVHRMYGWAKGKAWV